MAAFSYRYAVIRDIPDSYKSMSIRSDGEEEIDLKKAREQHTAYVNTLQELGVKVLEVPSDERFPDCVFVEDAAIVIDDTALICHPGAASRVGEEDAIRQVLKQPQLNLTILEVGMQEATIEGGDVMFTGKEIIVGLSKRTNQLGADALSKAFPKYPVTAVSVSDDGLHLKSVMSMISEGLIAISKSADGQDLKQKIAANAKYPYEFFELEDDVATNVLLVNGTVVHQNEIMVPRSWQSLQKFDKHPKISLNTSELAKADGCLSCCSILIP